MTERDPLEVDRLTRAALLRLRDEPALALEVCRDLVEIGFDPRTAWRLVETVVVPANTRRGRGTEISTDRRPGYRAAGHLARPRN
jgi:hypothetical protein